MRYVDIVVAVLPRRMVILQATIIAIDTAGFMWPPPKSPSVQAIVHTINPIPKPILEIDKCTKQLTMFEKSLRLYIVDFIRI